MNALLGTLELERQAQAAQVDSDTKAATSRAANLERRMVMCDTCGVYVVTGGTKSCPVTHCALLPSVRNDAEKLHANSEFWCVFFWWDTSGILERACCRVPHVGECGRCGHGRGRVEEALRGQTAAGRFFFS